MKGLHFIQVPSVIMLMITNQTPALQSADFKQILNKVSLITRIIKVKVGLSAEAKGLYILDITKNKSKNCLIIYLEQKINGYERK